MSMGGMGDRNQGSEESGACWMGTFTTTEEAAIAYDEAVLKFKGAKSKINFPDRVRARTNLGFVMSRGVAARWPEQLAAILQPSEYPYLLHYAQLLQSGDEDLPFKLGSSSSTAQASSTISFSGSSTKYVSSEVMLMFQYIAKG